MQESAVSNPFLGSWVHGTTYYTYGQRMQFVNIKPIKIVVSASTPLVKVVAPLPNNADGKNLNH